jgi:hypothetical protein
MKYLKIIVSLVMAVGLMAIVATPVLATQPVWITCLDDPENGQWENNLCSKVKSNGNWLTNEVVETVEITSSSSDLELTDTKAMGGAETIKCAESNVGWIGAEGSDGVSSVVMSKCERVAGLCESGKEVKVAPVSPPWGSELKEESGEVRDLLKTPGFKIECFVAGVFKVADTCEGATSAKVTNHSNGTVALEFEGKSAKSTCTLGGAGAGELKGTVVLKERSGAAMMQGPQAPVILRKGNPNFGGVKKNTTKNEVFEYENPNMEVEYTAIHIANISGNAFSEASASTCKGKKVAKSKCVIEIAFKPVEEKIYLSTLNLKYIAGLSSLVKAFNIGGTGTP